MNDVLVQPSQLAAAALAMRDGGVVLAGAAGIGKTHLARVVSAGHARERVRWVMGSGFSRRTAFGAFLPLLGSIPPRTDEALVVAHRALGAESSTLVVDDAHLLDEHSAALLLRLAVDGGCPIVVTLRTGEPAPDAVTALWKDGLLERLDLPGLTLDECLNYTERLLGGRVHSATGRLLWETAAGNISWLRHLVIGERHAGRVRCDHGIWRWSGRPRLSPTLTALVGASMGALTEGERHVLELLALAGPLDVDTVAALAHRSDVEDVADRKLVVVARDGAQWRARLAHPLYAEVLAAGMSALRARRLYGALVEMLAPDRGTGDHDLRLGQLALTYDPDPDPELLLAAARRAAMRVDAALTMRLATAARAAGVGFEADMLVALAHDWSMRGGDAEREYRAGEHSAADEAQLLRLVQARAANLALNLGRPRDGRDVLVAAARTPRAELELLGVRSLLDALDNRFERAHAAARRVLASSELSPSATGHAACALRITTAVTGLSDASAELVDRVSNEMSLVPDASLPRLRSLWWRAYGLGLAGRTGCLRDCLDRLAGAVGPAEMLLRCDVEGWLALVSGRLTTAVRLLGEFRSVLAGDGGGWMALLELRLAVVLGMTGDAVGARVAIARARSARHPAMTIVEPQFELAQAWADAAEGAITGATRHARKAALAAGRAGQFAIEVSARHAAVTFGDRGHTGRLRELSVRVRTPRALAAAAHAAAWTDRDDAALLAAAALFADAGLMLQAAEAAAQAEATARDRLDPEATATAAAVAAGYLAECDGARTPALELAARPLAISERQREAAAMVASGLSNREISERLGVSVRTVEGHIYHACVKLGVSNRAALAALLNRPSPRDRHYATSPVRGSTVTGCIRVGRYAC